MPLTDVAVTVPCKVPVPALRVAVMTRPLSVVIKLPTASSTRMTCCVANVTPAVAVVDGCVTIVSLLVAPTFTVIDGLVFAVLAGLEMSVAVRVCEPAVLSVTLTVRVPADNAPLTGSVALESLEVMPTESVLLTTFQLASTALTVTLKATPAVRAVGVPVLPVAVPGAAVSPGASNCSFTNAPAATVSSWLALLRPLLAAVIVDVPALGSLYLKLALLEPLAMVTLEIVVVSAASRKAYVPLESLLRATVMAASAVLGL